MRPVEIKINFKNTFFYNRFPSEAWGVKTWSLWKTSLTCWNRNGPVCVVRGGHHVPSPNQMVIILTWYMYAHIYTDFYPLLNCQPVWRQGYRLGENSWAWTPSGARKLTGEILFINQQQYKFWPTTDLLFLTADCSCLYHLSANDTVLTASTLSKQMVFFLLVSDLTIITVTCHLSGQYREYPVFPPAVQITTNRPDAGVVLQNNTYYKIESDTWF